MGKFAVGDYVFTKKLEDIERRLIITNNVPVCLGDKMAEYCGRCGVVTAVTKNGNYRLNVDGGNYVWHEDWLYRTFDVKIETPSFKPNFSDLLFSTFTKEWENKAVRLNIEDVKIIVPDKVVEVTFGDGTKEKAVCAEEDTYSFDAAITVCIAKYLAGSSGAFNKAVRKANKIMADKAKAADEAKAEEARKQKHIEKFNAWVKRKEEKKAEQKRKEDAEKREQEIELRKEAYKRAMKELEDEKAAASCQ